MSDVFNALGLRASWPLRAVCRRWRRVVEETEWAVVELRLKGGEVSSAAGHSESKRSAEHVCGALSALFDRKTGKLRLGNGASVTIKSEFCHFRGIVLWALRPLDGASSDLGGLSVGLTGRRRARQSPSFGLAGRPPAFVWPPHDALRAALAPRQPPSPPPAPILRSLRIRPELALAVLAALAPLARLEELALEVDSAFCSADAVAGGLWALAVVAADGLHEEGQFPAPNAGADPPTIVLVEIPEPLQRSLDTAVLAPVSPVKLHFNCHAARPEDAAVFLGSRLAREALAGLRLRIDLDEEPDSPRLFSDALAALPPGATLKLAWRESKGPLKEAEAKAILALPALRRLRVGTQIRPPSSAREDPDPDWVNDAVHPFEVLAGLRPEVAVSVDLAREGYEFDGRGPFDTERRWREGSDGGSGSGSGFEFEGDAEAAAHTRLFECAKCAIEGAFRGRPPWGPRG
eukprot:tig00000241_g20879.t1